MAKAQTKSATRPAQQPTTARPEMSLPQRVAAEALGTFLLVFLGAGAGATAKVIPHILGAAPSLTDWQFVALANGLALFIITMIFGKVSGAHVNPAITIGLSSAGRFPRERIPFYLGAQLLGAILGAVALLIVYGQLAATTGHLGAMKLAPNTNLVQGFAIEALGTFILALTISAAAEDPRAPSGWASLAIGMALATITMVLGPATGAALNPARALAPNLIVAFFGIPVDWAAYLVAYLLGPIVGAIIACFVYARVSNQPRQKPS